jgi:hypothetical protein
VKFRNPKKMTTNSTLEEDIDYFGLVLSYLPFVVIAIGVTGNTSAFIVFVTNKHLRNISSIVILSFIVVVRIFFSKNSFFIKLNNISLNLI